MSDALIGVLLILSFICAGTILGFMIAADIGNPLVVLRRKINKQRCKWSDKRKRIIEKKSLEFTDKYLKGE